MYNNTTNNRTRIWIDGAGDYTNSAGTNRGLTATDYRLGARANNADNLSRFYDGQVGEAIIFNNLLNNAERIVIENYLAALFSISTKR
jgi:hypothetical protein